MKKAILGVIALVIVILGVSLFMPAESKPQPAYGAAGASDTYTVDKPVEFDHSNCQYPDRWSNPVDGCDNTDPAVPECIKAMFSKKDEDACIAAFVKAHEQPAQPEPTTKPNTCEGK